MSIQAIRLVTIGTLCVAGAAQAASPDLPDAYASFSISGYCGTGGVALTLGQVATTPVGSGCDASTSFLATTTPAPSVRFSLTANSPQAAVAMISMTYFFRIASSESALVPVWLDGAYALVGANSFRSAMVTADGGQPWNFGVSSSGDGWTNGNISGSFHLLGSITTNQTYAISLRADGWISGTDPISVMLDPTLTIDTNWVSAHPDATLELSAGLGNTAPVPEPSQWAMVLLGGIVLRLACRASRTFSPVARAVRPTN